MKNEKTYAILCYLASACLFLVGVINLLNEVDASRLIFWFCSGSAMFCWGGVLLNKANKNDKDQ